MDTSYLHSMTMWTASQRVGEKTHLKCTSKVTQALALEMSNNYLGIETTDINFLFLYLACNIKTKTT